MNSPTLRLTAALVRYLQVQYSERDGKTRRLIPGMFGIFGHGNLCSAGSMKCGPHPSLKGRKRSEGGPRNTIGRVGQTA